MLAHKHAIFTRLLRAFSSHKITDLRTVAGGDTHAAYQLVLSNGERFFVKENTLNNFPLLEQEQLASQRLKDTQEILVPSIVYVGCEANRAFLVSEWLDLDSQGNEYLLGQQLAKLHRHTGPNYGWASDNFIGSTRQLNTWTKQWASFWWHQRLEPQLTLALAQGYAQLKPLMPDLERACERLLVNHQPEPSLLHGDLWGGNKGFCGGHPAIFDPASYFGDRETDIAFTHLFGGFSSRFYEGYQAQWPLPEGYHTRQTLYNLYHLLNHLNLFGEGYLADCLAAIHAVT